MFNSRIQPDPNNWIGTSTTRAKPTQRTLASLATPPPSSAKRPRADDRPILPTASGSRARRTAVQGDLRMFMAPTPPDSRSRERTRPVGADAASPSMGRSEHQRKRAKSGLRALQVFSDDDAELSATPKNKTRDKAQRPALAPKDPNTRNESSYANTINLDATPAKAKHASYAFSSDHEITPARARALEACKAIAPVRAKDRAGWKDRAPWVVNPLPSPDRKGQTAAAAAGTPLKRKRTLQQSPPRAVHSSATKLPRTTSLLERSFSESIDAESLAQFDFEKEVLDRVYKPRPGNKKVERHHSSPASLQSSSSPTPPLPPLPQHAPTQPLWHIKQGSTSPLTPLSSSSLEAFNPLDNLPSPGRSPSPLFPPNSSSSPLPPSRQFEEFAQTLFSDYQPPALPAAAPSARRRDFVPARQDPQTLMTWSAAGSSDPLEPDAEGTLDRWMEDEADVTRINAESFAARQEFEKEIEREVELALDFSVPTSDRPATPSRHVTFAPSPAAEPTDDPTILVPDSQESYQPIRRAPTTTSPHDNVEDFVPETLYAPAQPSASSGDESEVVPSTSSDPSEDANLIVPSSQSQFPLFPAIDRALLESTGDSTPRASQARKGTSKGKGKAKSDGGQQPKLEAFGFFPPKQRRRVRDFNDAFEEEPELSDVEVDEQPVISSQTLAPLFPAAPMHPSLREAGRRELLRRDEADQAVPSSQGSHEDRLSCLDGLSSLPSDDTEPMDAALENWINGLDARPLDAYLSFD